MLDGLLQLGIAEPAVVLRIELRVLPIDVEHGVTAALVPAIVAVRLPTRGDSGLLELV